MPLSIFTHEDCLKHEMGPYHPESPARLESVLLALKNAEWSDQLQWHSSPKATKEQLERVHSKKYIDSIFSLAPSQGYVQLDPDTMMNANTLPAALHAAGAVVAAVDEVLSGRIMRAFCAVRPPGHHAEPDFAMGFCFFNNIAIGVQHALSVYHLQRIAIVDFDVHHGNGTESMFLKEPKVCFWSSFQHPFYPGTNLTGKPSHIHLCPLSAGTNSHQFRQKVDIQLIPILEEFKPECIFVSAGFDAHFNDPLANVKLTSQDYGYIMKRVCDIANKCSKGRVISTLEGGYHLAALSESVILHAQSMLNSR
ncbi:MAG: histone deacetylase family protein [Gammaproteobacteria bacterium]|jgi:acetoin utilization deacetylase AcuC-like enzyme|nr:histone deacetylase family protein [Gammaproteobacteria bacterium]